LSYYSEYRLGSIRNVDGCSGTSRSSDRLIPLGDRYRVAQPYGPALRQCRFKDGCGHTTLAPYPPPQGAWGWAVGEIRNRLVRGHKEHVAGLAAD
jgi:hypothetical protein